MYHFYFRRILPLQGGMISGNASAYTYLPTSVSKFPSPEELKLQFDRAACRRSIRAAGREAIVTLHTGGVRQSPHGIPVISV